MDWGTLFEGVDAAAKVATTGYSIYAGQQAANQAEDLYSQAIGSTQAMDAIAKEQFELYKTNFLPVEQKRAELELRAMELGAPYQEKFYEDTTADIELFRPLKDELVRLATEEVDPNELAGRASSDVSQAFAKMRNSRDRDMASKGLNPNSDAFAKGNKTVRISEALADATARTGARRGAEETKWNRLGGALGYQRGLPVPQNSGANTSTNLNSAMSGLKGTADNFAKMGATAANAAGQNYQAGMFGLNLLTADKDQGGVDWSKLGKGFGLTA